MILTVIEIAEFTKNELEKTFNKKFDIYEDNLIDKILIIINDEYEIDYESDDYVCAILENLKDMNLKSMKKDIQLNITENLKEEDVLKIKQLISLYLIKSYEAIFKTLKEIL